MNARPDQQFRKNIRSRLMTLVALPLLVTLTSVVALERILERQVLNEATKKVVEARDILQMELDEHIRALKVELVGLSQREGLTQALSRGDTKTVQTAMDIFSEAYPEISLIAADKSGRVIVKSTQLDLNRIEELETLKMPSLSGEVTRALSLHGCARAGAPPHAVQDYRESSLPPARVLAVRLEGGGTIIACEKLDEHFLERVGSPLSMKLALFDETQNHLLLARSKNFPIHIRGHRGVSELSEADGELWAVTKFCPRLFGSGRGVCQIDALTALSVTNLRNTIRKDFALLLLPLILVGIFALVWGGRLAYTLDQTLDGLLGGFRRLERQDFALIEPVRTGNELEEIGHGFNHAVEGLREREHLRTTFGKYMTDTVVEHLLANQIRLGGDKLFVTVLFSDIRGFTAMSERLEAEQVVARLNEYFSSMVDVIMANGGVVDKYIGDALMVIFGAPVPVAQDALNAVKAAVEMREALAELNETLVARGEEPIRTGIGIHSGEVVAGNIGCERRMEYTVIGDAVNLASRLEGCTKDLGSDLLISEETYKLVSDNVEARFLKEITVKGREEPVGVYAVDAIS